jgi:hypothetical protein
MNALTPDHFVCKQSQPHTAATNMGYQGMDGQSRLFVHLKTQFRDRLSPPPPQDRAAGPRRLAHNDHHSLNPTHGNTMPQVLCYQNPFDLTNLSWCSFKLAQ